MMKVGLYVTGFCSKAALGMMSLVIDYWKYKKNSVKDEIRWMWEWVDVCRHCYK